MRTETASWSGASPAATRRWAALPARFAALALAVALAGCAGVKFYAQAVAGQASLLLSRRDLQAVVDDPRTDPALAAQLRLATAMLYYAAEELALPADGRYSSYADVGAAVVWNVVAARELELAAHSRCYPLIGCVLYRGYFARRDAEVEGRRLATHYDVHVYGVGAYSTLGWFDDPILSSFIHYDEAALAELLFHELAHGVAYVRNDTAFNESFASFVGRRGTLGWLAAQGEDADAHRQRRAREREAGARFARFLSHWRERLRALYALPIDDAAKRQLKAEAFATMRAAYRACRQRLGDGRFDGYMAAPFNNARMVLAGAYDDLVDGFARLFDDGGTWPAFYAAVRELAALPPDERHARLSVAAPAGDDAEAICAGA